MDLDNRRTAVQRFTSDCMVVVDRTDVNLKGCNFTIDLKNKLFFIESSSFHIINKQVDADTFDAMFDGDDEIIFTAWEIGNHFNSPYLIKE